MLPVVDALFTLVRKLATGSPVTEVSVPKWLVQRHGLGPLVSRAGVKAYRDELAQSTLQWGRTEQVLPPLVTALRTAGARVAAVKGVAYAKLLYGSPAERPMSDVDLMVPLRDRNTAEAVLTQLGFERGRSARLHHAAPWVRAGFVVDLHINIIAPGRSRIDLDAVWSRAIAGWPDGAEVLAPEDALVFHLIHFARNRLRLPLINVIDTARLLERADRTIALDRARAWGLATAVELALELCTSLLADRPGRPAGWFGPSREELAQLSKPGLASKLMFDVAVAGSPKQLLSRVVHFGANVLRRDQ